LANAHCALSTEISDQLLAGFKFLKQRGNNVLMRPLNLNNIKRELYKKKDSKNGEHFSSYKNLSNNSIL